MIPDNKLEPLNFQNNHFNNNRTENILTVETLQSKKASSDYLVDKLNQEKKTNKFLWLPIVQIVFIFLLQSVLMIFAVILPFVKLVTNNFEIKNSNNLYYIVNSKSFNTITNNTLNTTCLSYNSAQNAQSQLAQLQSDSFKDYFYVQIAFVFALFIIKTYFYIKSLYWKTNFFVKFLFSIILDSWVISYLLIFSFLANAEFSDCVGIPSKSIANYNYQDTPFRNVLEFVWSVAPILFFINSVHIVVDIFIFMPMLIVRNFKYPKNKGEYFYTYDDTNGSSIVRIGIKFGLILNIIFFCFYLAVSICYRIIIYYNWIGSYANMFHVAYDSYIFVTAFVITLVLTSI